MRRLQSPLVGAIAFLAIMSLPQIAQADGGSFVDDDNSKWEIFIETASAEGIVNGCNPPINDRFCPHDKVSRGSLAVMLARTIGAEDTGGDHFIDDDGHYAEGAIEALIGSGARFGCDVRLFCPDRLVSRAELATFITRTLKWEVADWTDIYVDVDDSPMNRSLAELAQRGAIEPCDAPSNTRLCPRSRVTREQAVFSLVRALGLEPEARDPGDDDALPTIDFGDSFDELALWDGRSPSRRNRVSLTDSGFKATALDVQIPKGSHFGADFRLDFSNAMESEPEKLFFRYFLRLDPDWATTSSGKLPGFSGVYGRTGKGGYQSRPWDPGWSARLMFRPSYDEDPRVHLGYYVYHLGQERRFGDSLMWNEAGRLLPGEWYCLEGEIELNTLGIADGALRAWVDDTPALDRTGLEFRRPTEPEIRIESFWFNVYYGGKAVAERDLGLTIDELVVDSRRIGCELGEGTSRAISADLDSDGYQDRVWWGMCPAGPCFRMQSAIEESGTRARDLGAGAWFSLESHRFGVSAGDLDGDGWADVLYRGRCDGSIRCWRVHRNQQGRLGPGENWGDGARFATSAGSLVLSDWSGDDLADLAYQGICGDDGHLCWRVHPGGRVGFEGPQDWGPAPSLPVAPQAADISGDGLPDLVYRAACGSGTCWFAQESTGSTFKSSRLLGSAGMRESENIEIVDFDGDGDSDFVTWRHHDGKTTVDLRASSPNGLRPARTLTELDGEVTAILMRRVREGSPLQALADFNCAGEYGCKKYLVSPLDGVLVDPGLFRDANGRRFPPPAIV